MKAIVLEVKNGTSACLREDGTIVKVHAKHPVGQTIELKEGKIVRFKEAIAELAESRAAEFIRDNAQRVAMAAAALVCVFLGTGIYSYNNLMAASYMSVDVNPSLEYTLNRMDKVIDVRALNDDAVKIVDELKEAGIKHATVAETISETTRILEKENYIASDKDNVMLVGITGANKHKSGDIDMQVHTVADGEMTERVSVYTLETSKQDRKEAQKRGISAGRYATAKAICDKNNVDMSTLSDDDFDQITHMSVASLLKEQDGETAEDEKDREEEEKKPEEKKEPEVSEAETLTTVSAPSEVKPVAATAAVDAANQSAEHKDETEDEEKESDSKKSSSKKKKTASGDSADKSKASVSAASAPKAAAKSGSENSAAAGNSTASANSTNAIVNTSENAVADATAAATKSVKDTTVATVTTDDGVALTVVVPDNTQIAAPQDTTVEQYEQTYKELVNAVTPAVTVVENTEAAVSGTAASTVETAIPEKTEETETVVEVKVEAVQATETTTTEKTE